LTSIPLLAPHDFDGVVELPRDDDADLVVDPTGNGALHWAPLYGRGLHERMRLIVDWVVDAHPAVVVSDVSVEVTALVRLLGVPVVVMAMPGQRNDVPHEMAYQLAEHIVAAWPRELYEPPWLQPHRHKTTYVGGISRFDGRRHLSAVGDGTRVLAMFGAGGSTVDAAEIARCTNDLPDVQWRTLGVAGGAWAEDPWPELCTADIVVAHAGQSSVADIAAAARPAIIIPQQRPFGEQHATAAVLARERLAVVQPKWPDPSRWRFLIEQARREPTARWQRWHTQGAARRAAAVTGRIAWLTRFPATSPAACTSPRILRPGRCATPPPPTARCSSSGSRPPGRPREEPVGSTRGAGAMDDVALPGSAADPPLVSPGLLAG
jgi:UDP-N-acetylglucosamine--N-acetylmuramyl-(pentapeptide) pyrophosphoryl-undecaprenol N-acetylglucosamine transferase